MVPNQARAARGASRRRAGLNAAAGTVRASARKGRALPRSGPCDTMDRMPPAPTTPRLAAEFARARDLLTTLAAAGRVGRPSALRLVVAGLADHGAWVPWAAEAGAWAAGVLGSPPETVAALGGESAGQVAVHMTCAGGQSALLAVSGAGEGPALVEATLFGSLGIADWQSDAAELITDGAPTAAAPPSDATRPAAEPERPEIDAAVAARLARAIRRALASGGVVRCGADADAPLADKPAPGGAARPAPSPEADANPAAGAIPRAARPRVAVAKPLGVLLVGGAMTHQEMYAAALAADPRCRLVAVADEADVTDRRRRLNAEFARLWKLPYLDSLDAALARDDVAVVSVCAEPERRWRIIERAAAAGKHLYLDKPLAASVEEADRIVRAVDRAGVAHQMFSLVHTAAAARARELLASGVLGELVAIHSDACFAKGMAGTAAARRRIEEPSPRQFESIEAKRELHNVGVYPLVLWCWLLGRRPRRVVAATGNYFFQEHQTAGMEDFAQLAVELDGGVVATLSAGRTGWRSHPAAGLHRTVFVGTRRTVVVDAARPRVEVYAHEEPWPLPERHPEDPMGFWVSTQAAAGVAPKRSWVQAAEARSDAAWFLDCLERGEPSDVPAQVGAAALEVILGAYRAAATGQAMDLPLPREAGRLPPAVD